MRVRKVNSNDIKIHDSVQVKLKTAGNTSVVQFTARNNKTCSVYLQGSSECIWTVFVDLFCGSIAMLCYLPWDVKVVVNDINGNLTNLYMVIRDRLSDFVSEVMVNDGITRRK